MHCQYKSGLNFNSTMVRLKGGRKRSASTGVFIFKFHYGEIKGHTTITFGCLSYSFQFHYGAIKGQSLIYFIKVLHQFQFHYGAIKGIISWKSGENSTYFNSTMVRLKEFMITMEINSF